MHCTSHLTANILNFSCNTELGIFIPSVTRTKLDMKAVEVASSVSVCLIKAESNDTAQFSSGSQAPWIRCVYRKAGFWYLLQLFLFAFVPVSSVEHGLLCFTEGYVSLEFRHQHDTN